MEPFKAICIEAGGGYVSLMVARDAQAYPGDGERVVVLTAEEYETLADEAAHWRAMPP
jgi:hypothetical protein